MPLPVPLLHRLAIGVPACSFVTKTTDPSRLYRAGLAGEAAGLVPATANEATFGVVGLTPDELAVDGDRTTLTLSPTVGRRVRKGEYLKAAADGFATPATYPTADNSGTDNCGAQAELSGAPGTRIPVTVVAITPTTPP